MTIRWQRILPISLPELLMAMALSAYAQSRPTALRPLAVLFWLDSSARFVSIYATQRRIQILSQTA